MEEVKKECRGVIYCYTNTVNGKMYVGQTTNEERRKREHKNCALRDKGYKGAFHKAIRKYGWDSFIYEVLIVCTGTKEEIKVILEEKEIYYIKTFKDQEKVLYNLTNGGIGHSGYVASEETKKKMSRKGEINGMAIKIIGPDRIIYPTIQEGALVAGVDRDTLSGWIKNKPEKGWFYYDESVSDEERQNLMAEAKAKACSKNKNWKSKKVIGPDGVIYESISQASRVIGVSRFILTSWIEKYPEKGWSYYTEEN